MKKSKLKDFGICPKCGKPIVGIPAMSRTDNRTAVCSDCGTREALTSMGICKTEQEQILKTIHAHSRT